MQTKLFCFLAALLFVFALFLPSCIKAAEMPKEIQTEEITHTEAETTEKIEETEPETEPEETAPLIELDEDDIEWNAALEKQDFEDDIIWLLDFINSHPNSKYIPEIEELIENIREDSSCSEKYLAKPTLDLIDEFISRFPGHKDIDKAYKLREEFAGDIYAMIQKGSIAAISVGESVMRNVVQIQNKTDMRLEVTIPFGTYFAANSGNVQNMLAREEKVFFVKPNQTGILYIDTVCMNIYKDIPGEKSYFTVDMLEQNSPLIAFLKILDENAVSYEIAQAAIWHILDNPGKEAILGALVYEDGEHAITESDYKEALRYIALIKTTGN